MHEYTSRESLITKFLPSGKYETRMKDQHNLNWLLRSLARDLTLWGGAKKRNINSQVEYKIGIIWEGWIKNKQKNVKWITVIN